MSPTEIAAAKHYRTVPQIRRQMVIATTDQMRRDMNLPPFKWKD